MPQITIDISDKIYKILTKRAKKNLMSMREQVEDIIRRSASKVKSGSDTDKIDDTLVSVFSRNRKGRRRK